MIEEGKDVTYDMKPHRDDPTAVGTLEMAKAIIRPWKPELEPIRSIRTRTSA